MKSYTVTGEFRITARTQEDAENIVQNAVEGTMYHLETIDVNAEPTDDEGDEE